MTATNPDEQFISELQELILKYVEIGLSIEEIEDVLIQSALDEVKDEL